MQCIIAQPLSFPFTSIGLVTELTTFTPTLLLNGSTYVPTPISYTEIGGGLYTINFTPTTVGSLSIFIAGVLYPSIDVVVTSTSSMLQDLSVTLQDVVDEALGSWSWDKVGGNLSLLRQDGSPLASFNVVDNLTVASRELI